MGKKTRALCVVAHPDDETIWMGGTILKNKDWNWTVFSLCRRSDPDRMPKFKNVCDLYRANSIITDLEDEKLKPLDNETIQDNILKNLSEKEFDFIFTHGENGEYGHLRHKETHKAIKELVEKSQLTCKNLYFFAYEQNDSEIPSPTKGDFSTILSPQELEKKQKIITNLYGFPTNSFEIRSCNKMEAFTLG